MLWSGPQRFPSAQSTIGSAVSAADAAQQCRHRRRSRPPAFCRPDCPPCPCLPQPAWAWNGAPEDKLHLDAMINTPEQIPYRSIYLAVGLLLAGGWMQAAGSSRLLLPVPPSTILPTPCSCRQ